MEAPAKCTILKETFVVQIKLLKVQININNSFTIILINTIIHLSINHCVFNLLFLIMIMKLYKQFTIFDQSSRTTLVVPV